MVTVAVLWCPSQSSSYIPLWLLTLTRHCPCAYCESFMVEEEHPSTATISEIQQTCHLSKSLLAHSDAHFKLQQVAFTTSTSTCSNALSCCWLSKQLTVIPNKLASECVINVNVTISNINAFYTFPGQNTHPCILRYAGAVLAVEEGSSWYGFQIWEMRVAIMSPICLSVGRAGGHKALEGYIHSNELSLSFNSLTSWVLHTMFFFNLFPDRTGAAVQVPSSFHPDQISPFLLLPLCQPPAVRGFSLTGSGALLYPPDSLAVFPLSLAWAQCHCWDICTAGGWHERPSSSSSSLLLPLSNGSSLCFIPLSSCPSRPRTFLPSTSLLPRSPLHLPTPSLLTSSCPPLAICRKH